MRERQFFSFTTSLLGLAAGAVLGYGAAGPLFIPALLGTVCLLAARLLAGLLKTPPAVGYILALATGGAALWLFGSAMLPLLCVLLCDACLTLSPRPAGWALAGVCSLLLCLLLRPQPAALLCTGLAVPLFGAGLVLLRQLAAAREAEAARASEAEALRRRLAQTKQGVKAMAEAARVEERNRIAVRIHDRVGHGVSGSVLLVEAALLTLGTQPEKAKQTLQTAADNLRASVDDIRAALREERAAHHETGLAALRATLADFEATHGIRASLTSAGSLTEISPATWQCIGLNLQEALTNLLLHSAATTVSLDITRQDKLVTATIRDNGGAEGPITPGMGLDAMAARCAASGGRLFYTGDASGFTITMTFTGEANL